jgi:hypothetical protein
MYGARIMTPQAEGSSLPCQAPIDQAVLTDYWLALLSPSEEERIETHLLSCDACGACLGGIIQLSEALNELARSGALRVVIPEEFIAHAIEDKRRVRQYQIAPSQTVPCTISADDELLVARLTADLSGAVRVDLSFCDTRGVERHRMDDIPVRVDARWVIFQESAVFAKAAPSSTMVARLLAVGEDGAERLLGEYTLQHTRTIPGPPGWEW